LDVRIKYKDANILALYPDATKGENIVIYNILQEIQGFDQNADVNTELEKLTVADCSTAKLKTLCETYPSFQPLFAKAIETMNGSSSVLAPDLVDTLSGVVRLNEGTT